MPALTQPWSLVSQNVPGPGFGHLDSAGEHTRRPFLGRTGCAVRGQRLATDYVTSQRRRRVRFVVAVMYPAAERREPGRRPRQSMPP